MDIKLWENYWSYMALFDMLLAKFHITLKWYSITCINKIHNLNNLSFGKF